MMIHLLLTLLYILGTNGINDCYYKADYYDKNHVIITYDYCKDYYSCYNSYRSLMSMNGTQYVCYVLLKECCFDIIQQDDGNFISFSLDSDNRIIKNTIFHSSSFSVGFYIQCLRRLKDGVTLFCMLDDAIMIHSGLKH